MLIAAPSVTLDLDGFQIVSLLSPATGSLFDVSYVLVELTGCLWPRVFGQCFVWCACVCAVMIIIPRPECSLWAGMTTHSKTLV